MAWWQKTENNGINPLQNRICIGRISHEMDVFAGAKFIDFQPVASMGANARTFLRGRGEKNRRYVA